MDTRLYSLESVAAILDTDEAEVLAWVAAGEFPAPVLLPNGQRRWASDAVARWIGDRPTDATGREDRAA